MKTKRFLIEFIIFLLPLLLALICLLSVSHGSHQAALPIPMPQEFVGEYSYDRTTWQPLTEGAGLSALDGDLYLRGHFLREMPAGTELNFFRNHIGISIYADGALLYTDELLILSDLNKALFASMCAQEWTTLSIPALTPDTRIEIHLHNPHRIGNADAYREFLSTMCATPPGSNLLEQRLVSYGRPFRVLGVILCAASLMLIGAAAAAAAARIPVGRMLVKLGMLALFSGGFITFDVIDLSFWNDLKVFNTYARQLCMMLAVFCLDHFVADMLTDRRRRIAMAAAIGSGLIDSVLIALSFTGFTVIYDTLPIWVLSQAVLCPVLMLCCGLELRRGSGNTLSFLSVLLLFAAILLDIAGVGATLVWRTPCAKILFLVLFMIQIILGAKGVVKNYKASIQVARLEQELENSRISIMLSQIKPHFLYNVLNSIYHLYRKEPETAQEAVSSFADYLRCNMLSIEKSEPIPFSEEYRHVQTYLSLEQLRFRNKLDVIYDVEETDFKLPPLTVEPLVENAVKHGIVKKRGGGIVTISTRRTGSSYVITVSDTGVGFDVDHYMEDGKPHIGITNVTERLQAMVGGTLSITSSQDGTTAVVTIPIKEETKTNENNRS